MSLSLLGCQAPSSASNNAPSPVANPASKPEVNNPMIDKAPSTNKPEPAVNNAPTEPKPKEDIKMTATKEGTVRIEGGEGTGEQGGTSTVTEEELGLAYYPNSTAKSGNDFKFEGGNENVYSSSRETTDDVQKVVAWYQSKVETARVSNDKGIWSIGGYLKDGSSVAIAARPQGSKTEIDITTRRKKN